jgi:hypothetical protein
MVLGYRYIDLIVEGTVDPYRAESYQGVYIFPLWASRVTP